MSDAEVDTAFNAAVLRMTQAEASKRHEAVVHQHAMALYGLLQQATKGDNDTDRPRCPINNTGKAKWDAWTARAGMASEAAKQEYTRLVASILPPADSSAQETTSRGLQLKRWTPLPAQAQQTIFLHLLMYVGAAMFATHFVVVLAQHINATCAVGDSVLCAAWHRSYWLRLGGSWTGVGLAFGTLLQTHVVQLLSVLYVTVPRVAGRRPATPVETCPHLAMVKKFNLSMGKVGTATEEHPVMTFVPEAASTPFPPYDSPIEHPFEKAADMHFRRFKEPFPDPFEPALVGIDVTVDFEFTKWNCVYKQRKLKLKNTAPGFIKRFAGDEFIFFVEESLWDKANNVLYVRGFNESFADLALVRSFAVYATHPENDAWSSVMQTGSVQMSNKFGFLRSTVEGFVKESYAKTSTKALAYLKVRLVEERAEAEVATVMP
ncbi:hypothetical protein SDRG_06285 [Saprolegnia diclina VS20]|uniref:ACB domain-containing protein n=1 Tax=Saprolegnia diclina (strain VS20) TaxID=1156394 RepID=T0S0I5_SAPDV|nr:hypothetical protein SDRG_06285 [Saprolegnia diclina VS20]EQC36172.1 hypothetical protein SDRG_06285 [Saprolegnia diclina VS20]|eukprot:XP_008610278.1 hypothetical protein SDRG_06285 [Saprolegnia diclina VS20]